MFILKRQMGMQEPLQMSTIHYQLLEELRIHTKGMHLLKTLHLHCTEFTVPSPARFEMCFSFHTSWMVHSDAITGAPESARSPCKACCAIQERGSGL